jgi:hypothetical protein
MSHSWSNAVWKFRRRGTQIWEKTMRKTAFAALFAFAIATNSWASAAGPVDWDSYRALRFSHIDVKTNGIANLEMNYRDKRCPYQTTEQKRKDCFAAYKEVIARLVKERTVLRELIKATYLPPVERDRVVDMLHEEYEKSNVETGRMERKAAADFPPPK